MRNVEWGMGNGEWGINGCSAAVPDIPCQLGLNAPTSFNHLRCLARITDSTEAVGVTDRETKGLAPSSAVSA